MKKAGKKLPNFGPSSVCSTFENPKIKLVHSIKNYRDILRKSCACQLTLRSMEALGCFANDKSRWVSFRPNDIPCLTLKVLFWHTTCFYVKLKLVSKCKVCQNFLILEQKNVSLPLAQLTKWNWCELSPKENDTLFDVPEAIDLWLSYFTEKKNNRSPVLTCWRDLNILQFFRKCCALLLN